MKIGEARDAYSAQLQHLQARRQSLQEALREQERGGGQSFDRIELSRELEQTNVQYEAVRQGMEGITARWISIVDAESARQQNEAMTEQYKDYAKILEVYRRIASGGRVPPADETKLMKYSSELYMAAKNMALMNAQKGEDYDSLWGDEEERGEEPSAMEIADGTEIDAAAPEAVAAAAVSEEAPAE